MEFLVSQGTSYLKYILSLLGALTISNASAQYQIDSLSLQGDITGWYDQRLGLQNTVLQHGELATIVRKSPNSHAFFQQSTWIKTNITYSGQTFRNILAVYDIENDKLIISNNLGASFNGVPLELRKELVERFQMGDNRFIYVEDAVSWHEKGFFKAVYEGDSIDLLSKVFKRLEFKYSRLTYKEAQQYFLKKDGRYHRLRRLSGLLKLFPEHKREIRQYKKELSLRRIDNPKNEGKLALLVGYCENLDKK